MSVTATTATSVPTRPRHVADNVTDHAPPLLHTQAPDTSTSSYKLDIDLNPAANVYTPLFTKMVASKKQIHKYKNIQ